MAKSILLDILFLVDCEGSSGQFLAVFSCLSNYIKPSYFFFGFPNYLIINITYISCLHDYSI